MQETCNAVTKDGPRLHICELPLHHKDDEHQDGDYRWRERTLH